MEKLIELTKIDILENILKEVSFIGWNDQAIKNFSLKNAKTPDYYLIYFPNGIEEVIDYFINKQINDFIEEFDKSLLEGKKIREKIACILKEIIKRTIDYYFYPTNLKIGLGNLWNISNYIWHLAGDRSLDFSYYTKRVILTKIILSIFLFWVSDYSIDNNQTYEFIDRQIDKVMKFMSLKKFPKEIFENLQKMPFIRLISSKKFW